MGLFPLLICFNVRMRAQVNQIRNIERSSVRLADVFLQTLQQGGDQRRQKGHLDVGPTVSKRVPSWDTWE